MIKIIRILVLVALVITAGTFYYLGLRDQANVLIVLGACSELAFWCFLFFSKKDSD